MLGRVVGNVAEKSLSMIHEYELFTDGACQPNPGKGGWAFILVRDDKTETIGTGRESQSTNNRMEMTAVIEGIKKFAVLSRDADSLVIYSDSSYLVNGITSWMSGWSKNGWCKSDGSPILNPDLWKILYELKLLIPMRCVQVKGHAGHEMNERVDKLACEAIGK